MTQITKPRPKFTCPHTGMQCMYSRLCKAASNCRFRRKAKQS